MANVTFKKSLILFVLALILSFSSFGQKKGKLKEFSKEFPVFITELDDFMTASDNSELKSAFKAFNKASTSFSPTDQSTIIEIANKMLAKRLKPKPHFNDFLKSLIVVNKQTYAKNVFSEW